MLPPGARRPPSVLALIHLVAALAAPAAVASEPAAPAPAAYSLPWLMRPAAIATVVRLDETLAFSSDPASGRGGTTAVTSLTGSYRLGARWALILRQTFVANDPAAGPSGRAFSNTALALNHVRPLRGPWRLTGFAGATLPLGSGGGDDPDAGAAAAIAAGVPARSGMDNTLLAVNYWGGFAGVGVARVTPRLTAQLEATLLQTLRARGPGSQDGGRTNLTLGLHLGHFLLPRLSLGGELRMQRWLSDAAPVRADPSARSQFTFGIGPRLHFRTAAKSWVRPGLSYARALDRPMSGRGYDILQLDVPISF